MIVCLYEVIAPLPSEERLRRHNPDQKEPETVFIDLRKSMDDVEEERNKLAVVQRVLKLNEPR